MPKLPTIKRRNLAAQLEEGCQIQFRRLVNQDDHEYIELTSATVVEIDRETTNPSGQLGMFLVVWNDLAIGAPAYDWIYSDAIVRISIPVVD